MSNLLIPNKLKPAIAAILSSWLTLTICIASPLIDKNPKYISIEFLCFATTSFLIFYCSFFTGAMFGPWKKITISYKSALFISISAAATSIAFRYIDRFYFRPVSNYFDISSVRDSRVDGSNLFSITSVILLPISIAIFLKLRDSPKGISKFHRAVFILIFFMATMDVISTGSRGILLCLLIFLFYKRITLKTLAITIPLLIISSGLFFLIRYSAISATDDIQSTLDFVSKNGYAEFVPISEGFSSDILSSQGGQFFFPIIQVNQYFAHGLFEFAYQYNFGPEYQLDPSRIVPQLSKIASFTSVLIRPNLYYTTPGTFYIAFGKFSLIALIISGLILGTIYRRALKESTGAKGVVLFSLFLTPFVNNIAGFDLQFYLAAIYIASSIKVKNPYHSMTHTI